MLLGIKICCPTLKLCYMDFYYLHATLEFGYILVFRLTHRLATGTKEDCTLFQTSLWVCSAKYESNSYLDPWRVGLETLTLFGLQAGSQTCTGPLGGQRGPALSALWVARQQPLDLWNQPTSHVAVEQKKKHRDRLF